MNENKQEIMDSLVNTLQLTREYEELTDLKYVPEEEVVVVYFDGYAGRQVNVACDSGIAMIRDVLRAIM